MVTAWPAGRSTLPDVVALAVPVKVTCTLASDVDELRLAAQSQAWPIDRVGGPFDVEEIVRPLGLAGARVNGGGRAFERGFEHERVAHH